MEVNQLEWEAKSLLYSLTAVQTQASGEVESSMFDSLKTEVQSMRTEIFQLNALQQ